ncbi:MAG: thiol reductant ABC exporter subunit CydD [Rhodocyclaceae bacterium]
MTRSVAMNDDAAEIVAARAASTTACGRPAEVKMESGGDAVLVAAEARSAVAPDAALRWLNDQARCASRWSRLAMAAGALQALATVAQAAMFAWLLEGAIVGGLDWHDLSAVFWWLPLPIGLRALAGYVRDSAGVRASREVRETLRQRLLAQLYALGPAWASRRQGGALVSQLLEQVDALDGYVARYRPQRILAVWVPMVILCAVFPFNWAAGAILLGTAPLIPAFMALVGHAARARQQAQLQALAEMSGQFLEAVRGLPTLRLLDAHRRHADEVARTADHFRRRTMSVLRLAFLSGTVLEFFASLAIALVAVYFGFSLLGVLDFGGYGAPVGFFVLMLAPEFYLPLRELGTHYHARAEALAAAALLMPTLEDAPVATAGSRAAPLQAPEIVLDSVVFSHLPGVPVLDGANLHVAAGEIVAIVGASGAGKTTLLRLIQGELRPSGGALRIDGQPLDALCQRDWRERLGWMSQHPRLMAASLADNLRVARHDADDDALRAALHFAGLDDWFATLPKGLATPLGEGGRRLSGGQLRRLALARLRLRQASVLLLDEPTASLDSDTEALVIARLAALCRGRSVILLSHREAPLRLAQRVLYLAHGRLLGHPPPPDGAGRSPTVVATFAQEPLASQAPNPAPTPGPSAAANPGRMPERPVEALR